MSYGTCSAVGCKSRAEFGTACRYHAKHPKAAPVAKKPAKKAATKLGDAVKSALKGKDS